MRFPSRLAASLLAITSAVVLSACGSSSSTVATITTTTLNLPGAGAGLEGGGAPDNEQHPDTQASEKGSDKVLDGDALWDNTTEIPQAERPEPRVDLAQHSCRHEVFGRFRLS